MKIIIIEDNVVIADNTAEFLRIEWYEVDVFYHGEKGLEELVYQHNQGVPYDLAILDRMLPWIDGLSIGRVIVSKKISTKFIFLTAKNRQFDIIEWLEIQADDYLVKPFDLDELVLRIKNILRRWNNISWDSSNNGIIQVGDFVFDLTSHQIQKNDVDISLSPKEFAIIEHLLRNKGSVVSRESLYEQVWHEHSTSVDAGADTINVHMTYLRRKLGKDLIRTVKWVGYIIDND